MVTAVENGVSGYVDTNVDHLIERMRELLENPELARQLSEGARRQGWQRFNIARFVDDWNEVLALVTHTHTPAAATTSSKVLV
jgi:glycosyltransferase involved in cell wall biosynthesis